jgi:hypothetical protein
MANPNVIDYAPFGKYPRPSNNYLSVREEEGKYDNQQLLDKIQILLNKPLWPQFLNGAYLSASQASRFYRTAQGIQGLTHILNRSAYARSLSKDYDNEPDHSISEPKESQLWAALIEISTELANLADDLHSRAVEDLRQ